MKKSDFRKLQSKWNKKLAASGFEDAEATDRKGNVLLKVHGDSLLRQRYDVELRFSSIQRYYELASQFYWDHYFDTSREKEIWKLHADGVSTYDIGRKLKMSKSAVHRVTQRLARLMLAQRVGDTDD